MASIIRVDDLQDSGGNSYLSSNGSGTVTVGNSALKNTPSFLVTVSGTQSIPHNTYTKVQFNSELYDTDNTFDSSSNYRFTPAVAGKYQFGFGTLLTSLENDEKLQVLVRKNGSDLAYDPQQRFYSTNSGGETVTAFTNIIAEANTTDYFEAWVFHKEGGSRDIGSQSYFYGYKLIGA